MSAGSKWRYAPLLLLLAQVSIGLIYLDSVPRFFNDEGWEASIGYAVATEGRPRVLAMSGCGGMGVGFVQSRIVLP